MERAGFWIRFVAMLIDGILIGIVQFVLLAVFGGGLDPDNVNVGFELIISFLLLFGYYVWFQTKYNGQTLGKRMMGIRVLTVDGDPVRMGQMALREILGKFLSGLIFLIGYLIAAGKAKRALHDYLAKTIVVRNE
ncbi:RDD family protein [Anaerobacillus alkaliphilus]|uniref:RDD family protein n=1 Tax=Anaerobacillus alkaliphilus TaxID=1548597 RepID=A0A4Q0VMS2_9BACI|nr:RDD family protein [Anaerobacillus alkaliphilus]RXI96641.1 RDD family protein [Anaerobacillus alkaliphilus]